MPRKHSKHRSFFGSRQYKRARNLGIFYSQAMEYLNEQKITPEAAFAEIDGLNSDEVWGIAQGLSRSEVLDLDKSAISALLDLHEYGLTADHLREYLRNNNFGYPHYQLLKKLITKSSFPVNEEMEHLNGRKNTPKAALVEIEGLNSHEAWGIARGLSRSDVLGLNDSAISALLDLHEYGLTADHLRAYLRNNNFRYPHCQALKKLVIISKFSVDKALAEISRLEKNSEIWGIYEGLPREDVLGLSQWGVQALLHLRQYGLTADQLRQHLQCNELDVEHYKALKNLMTERGEANFTAEAALAKINGLSYREMQDISRGGSCQEDSFEAMSSVGFSS